MREERMSKEVYEANVSGRVDTGRFWKTYAAQISNVHNKDQIKSTCNQHICM